MERTFSSNPFYLYENQDTVHLNMMVGARGVGIESRSEECYYGSEGIMSLYQNVLIPELKCIACGLSAPFAVQSAKHGDDVVMNVLKNVFQSFANFFRDDERPAN